MPAGSTPIIVGVGQFTNPVDASGYQPLSAVEVAAGAARAALSDACATSALEPSVDLIATTRTFEDTTPHLSTPFGKTNNFPRSIAKRVGVEPQVAIWEVAGGNTPQHLVTEMCDRIANDQASVVLLAGGEAVSTVRDLMARNETIDWSETLDEQVEDRGVGMESLVDDALTKHGVVTAPALYGLLENARRAKRKYGRAEYAQEMAELFAPFTMVAASNPNSSSDRSYSPRELVEVGESNRLISDPYPRLLVARDQVNMGAALLLTSVDRAIELGIPEKKWIYLNGCASLRERMLLERADMGASPAAGLASEAALEAAGIEISDVSYLDLYSCFPISVSAVTDALGLHASDRRRLTVTGGLPYFGGPGSNYSMHAIASMVECIRADAGSYGFVGANGGILTKYSVGIYSSQHSDWQPLETSSLQAQIDSLPKPTVVAQADGEAEIETYTLNFARSGEASSAVVVGRLKASGARFVAVNEDGDLGTLIAMQEADPLGRLIKVRTMQDVNYFALK